LTSQKNGVTKDLKRQLDTILKATNAQISAFENQQEQIEYIEIPLTEDTLLKDGTRVPQRTPPRRTRCSEKDPKP